MIFVGKESLAHPWTVVTNLSHQGSIYNFPFSWLLVEIMFSYCIIFGFLGNCLLI